MWFWWRGSTCTRVRIIPEGICWSRGAIVTMKGFSAFLDKRWCKNWPHKKTAPENIYLKTCPASHHPAPPTPNTPSPATSLLLSTECLISAPLWSPFRGCWKSATAAAYDLILVEADGKCQFVVDNPWRKLLNSKSYHFSPHLPQLCQLLDQRLSATWSAPVSRLMSTYTFTKDLENTEQSYICFQYIL